MMRLSDAMMPYAYYRRMADDDVQALVAYLDSLPAVRNALPKTSVSFPTWVFIKGDPQPVVATIPPADPGGGAVYGDYLAAMAACGEPISVQKVLTPILPGFERVARWMYARSERSAGGRGPRRPLGAASPLAQAELRAALEAQQQPLFWLELRVVSNQHAACRMVAGAIAGRRGENVLCQRNTTFSRAVHRRRVDLARPEAIPSWRHAAVSDMRPSVT